MRNIRFIVNSINTEVFKLRYSESTYNFLLESQIKENKWIKYGGKLYIPLYVEKENKNWDILVYMSPK